MPLPSNNSEWPPKPLAKLLPKIDEWSAWYTGNPDDLRTAYSPGGLVTRPSQYAGGLVGAFARFWWGRPNLNPAQSREELHIPIAGDIAQASADLLYSDPVTATVEDPATQDRLNSILDDGMYTTLAESAEIAAALTGSYLRVTWDRQLADRPFGTVVHPDSAYPEFRWGRLVAVTFWYAIVKDGNTFLRHLERHELDASGNGVILHGLYQGTANNLGKAVPLNTHSSTANLSPATNTGPGLAAVYFPNQRPQRTWRKDPLGCNFGRSDLDGVESLMDKLDEAWASWMRDIRLGRGRILAAESVLEQAGPGQGTYFDTDREVFQTINMLQGPDSAGMPIQAVQFAIRYAEHKATIDELLNRILSTAGYSAQTFGLQGDGSAITATEVDARDTRSALTRDRKIRLQRPALAAFLQKLLQVDALIFNSGVVPELPTVQWADSAQESMLSIAQTAQALRAAEAASTQTLVEMVHPDWDDNQVTEEVDRIEAAKPAVPEPFSFNPGVDESSTDNAAGDLDSNDAGKS